jgi:hypothetical protein
VFRVMPTSEGLVRQLLQMEALEWSGPMSIQKMHDLRADYAAIPVQAFAGVTTSMEKDAVVLLDATQQLYVWKQKLLSIDLPAAVVSSLAIICSRLTRSEFQLLAGLNTIKHAFYYYSEPWEQQRREMRCLKEENARRTLRLEEVNRALSLQVLQSKRNKLRFCRLRWQFLVDALLTKQRSREQFAAMRSALHASMQTRRAMESVLGDMSSPAVLENIRRRLQVADGVDVADLQQSSTRDATAGKRAETAPANPNGPSLLSTISEFQSSPAGKKVPPSFQKPAALPVTPLEESSRHAFSMLEVRELSLLHSHQMQFLHDSFESQLSAIKQERHELQLALRKMSLASSSSQKLVHSSAHCFSRKESVGLGEKDKKCTESLETKAKGFECTEERDICFLHQERDENGETLSFFGSTTPGPSPGASPVQELSSDFEYPLLSSAISISTTPYSIDTPITERDHVIKETAQTAAERRRQLSQPTESSTTISDEENDTDGNKQSESPTSIHCDQVPLRSHTIRESAPVQPNDRFAAAVARNQSPQRVIIPAANTAALLSEKLQSSRTETLRWSTDLEQTGKNESLVGAVQGRQKSVGFTLPEEVNAYSDVESNSPRRYSYIKSEHGDTLQNIPECPFVTESVNGGDSLSRNSKPSHRPATSDATSISHVPKDVKAGSSESRAVRPLLYDTQLQKARSLNLARNPPKKGEMSGSTQVPVPPSTPRMKRRESANVGRSSFADKARSSETSTRKVVLPAPYMPLRTPRSQLRKLCTPSQKLDSSITQRHAYQ